MEEGGYSYEIEFIEFVERINEGFLPSDCDIKNHDNHLNISHNSLLNINVEEPQPIVNYYTDSNQD